MNSELITRWTAIITKLAVVIGLVVVALEFRSNTRAIQADRVNSNAQFYFDINSVILQDEELAALRYKAISDPMSLTDNELLRYNAYLDMHYGNYLNIYRNYRDGLVSEEDWAYATASIGFAFFSEPAREYVAIMNASDLKSPVYTFIEESVKNARAFCKNPDNQCVKRYAMKDNHEN